jgi:3-oxoacid CoA-transferase subunit A
MPNKIFENFDEVVADVPDGATIAIESWGIPATPQNLIAALKRHGARSLTIITHVFIPMVWREEDAALPCVLLPQMKKLVAAVIGIQRLGAGDFLRAHVENGLEVEMTTHGLLATRLYAGAAGLGGIYDPVGIGTMLEEGKEKRVINGKEYLFQVPIKPDYALITAHKADSLGNLVYQGNYRSDQPSMAMAARITVAEVEEIVDVGDIDADHVVTPGVFVDRIVKMPEGGLGSRLKGHEMIRKLGEVESVRDMLFGKDN